MIWSAAGGFLVVVCVHFCQVRILYDLEVHATWRDWVTPVDATLAQRGIQTALGKCPCLLSLLVMQVQRFLVMVVVV